MPLVSGFALWSIYGLLVMDFINFGIVFPLLPSISKEFGASATQVGSLAIAFSLAQMLCSPLLGCLSDRHGRRPVLMLAIAGSVLSSLLSACAWDFLVLACARAISGCMGATGGVANAYVADVTNKEERAVYMAYVSGAIAVGILIGPAVGGVLIAWGFRTALLASAGLSAVNLVMCAACMPESRWLRDGLRSSDPGVGTSLQPVPGANGSDKNPHSAATSPPPPAKSAPKVKLPSKVYVVFMAFFLFVLAFAAFETVCGYFLMDTYFDGDPVAAGRVYGWIFMAAGIENFIFSVFLFGPVSRTLGPVGTLILGATLRFTGFMLMPNMPSAWWFLFAVMVQNGGSQFNGPIIFSTLSGMCSEETQGRAMGLNDAAGAMARIVGPACFGLIYDNLNHYFSFYFCGIAGAFAGAMMIAVAWLVERGKRRAAIKSGAESGSPKLLPRTLSERVDAAMTPKFKRVLSTGSDRGIISA